MKIEIGYREDFEKVLSLYKDENWTNYTNDIPKLKRAFESSQIVYSIWDQNKLVGILRCISDRETILYIQDIIIKKEYKRKGLGKGLIKKVLDDYPEIRQSVLISDASESLKSFYTSLGFKLAGDKVINGYYLFR